MKRCECNGPVNVKPMTEPLDGLYCADCGGWFTLNLVTREQFDEFARINESPVKHPGQIRYDHHRGES